jgi:hypothetical protein
MKKPQIFPVWSWRDWYLAAPACANPYDPVQRTIGGGLIGTGSGAAIGVATAGGHGTASRCRGWRAPRAMWAALLRHRRSDIAN